jgi:hypothetical protein
MLEAITHKSLVYSANSNMISTILQGITMIREC